MARARAKAKAMARARHGHPFSVVCFDCVCP